MFFHECSLQRRHVTCLSPLPILLLHGHLLCGLLYEGRAHCPLNGMGRGGKGTRWGVQRRLTVSVLWVGVSSPFRGRMPIPKAMWSSVPLLWVFKKPCNASFSLHAKVKLSHGTSPIKCSLGSFCDPGHTRHFER